MPELLRDTHSPGPGETTGVPTLHPGSALPAWPVLPGRPEPDLDRLAGHVRNVLQVRAAVVSLVSAAGQVVPGAGGRWDGGRSFPHAWSLCSEVVRTGRPLLVRDVRSWTAPAGMLGPVVPWLRAYAGVPLSDETGRVVGAVSALVDRPRRWVLRDVQELERTAVLCRDVVTLRAAQIALEQCVAEASWSRRRARHAAERAEADLARAKADHERHQMVSAVAEALAEVAGTATDATEISAAIEGVLARRGGVASVRWAVPAEDQIWSMPWLSSTDAPSTPTGPGGRPPSLRLPVVTQFAGPSALVLEWARRRDLQPEDHQALNQVGVLAGQALDRMHLVQHWQSTAHEVVHAM